MTLYNDRCRCQCHSNSTVRHVIACCHPCKGCHRKRITWTALDRNGLCRQCQEEKRREEKEDGDLR